MFPGAGDKFAGQVYRKAESVEQQRVQPYHGEQTTGHCCSWWLRRAPSSQKEVSGTCSAHATGDTAWRGTSHSSLTLSRIWSIIRDRIPTWPRKGRTNCFPGRFNRRNKSAVSADAEHDLQSWRKTGYTFGSMTGRHPALLPRLHKGTWLSLPRTSTE